MRSRRSRAVAAALLLGTGLLASPATADPDPVTDPVDPGTDPFGPVTDDPADPDGRASFSDDPEAALAELEAAQTMAASMGGSSADAGDPPDTLSAGQTAKPEKPKKGVEMPIVGLGERLEEQATTDVWHHKDFAYTGTFDSPCGGDPEAGVWVWDTWQKNDPQFSGIIPSPPGSRSNDVKVDRMSSGEDILVHSNEVCGEGGVGGFEIYNVSDPTNPVHLAHVQTDDVNAFLQEELGYVDFGVHNLFLFQQGDRDYVAAKANSLCGNFQVYDITDPAAPEMVGFWGAEQLHLAELGFEGLTCADLGEEEIDLLIEVEAWLLSGYGASAHKLLHDITITEDGTQAYLSNWDAGLVLLDISDPTAPEPISTAIDVENGSLDGEVNSHSAWPNEDGSIVVEGEEDFNAWGTADVPPGSLTFGEGDPPAPLPGSAIATSAGDLLDGSQTGNEVTLDVGSLVVDSGPLAGEELDAIELGGDQPQLADVGPLSGEAVWIGQACDGDEILNADAIDPGDIAIARRGECAFRDKNFNAAEAGAAAVVIANNLVEDTPWSGIRVWDYSDPANPVLASTYDTDCSAAPEPIPGCDPDGTYSVHNVVVETVNGRVLAYLSWYYDGMIVLDVTDPYNPTEVAQFFDNSPEFIDRNGGNPHDFWGVWKEAGRPWIYGSDRNGGLYIFKLKGKGFG